MKKMVNQVYLNGVAYEHDLELRKTGEKSKQPNTEYIRGTLKIATDDAETNICEVNYTYVTATQSSFAILKGLIDGTYATRMNAKEGQEPIYLRIDSSVAVNDFYSDRSGKPELVSSKRNEGGFLHIIRKNEMKEKEDDRNTFKVDMVINKFVRVEGDEERGLPEKATVGGVVFNFRNEILPVEFTVLNPKAMDYFESQDINSSNVFFSQLWGNQVSMNFVKRTEVENAFGGIKVEESIVSRKDWVVTGAITTPYEFGEEGVLTAEELAEAVANRNTHLAEVKARYDEYKAQKVSTPAAIDNSAVKAKTGSFKF